MAGHEAQDEARDFEAQRRYLGAVAYRMLGSLADAEDVLQEAWLRWRGVDHAAVENPRAYLTTVVTRLCYDQLGSARARREAYFGEWLPEPLVDDAPGPQDRAEVGEEVSLAVMTLLERLSPAERAAFVLHDVFGVEFPQIATTLERSEASVRQLASRARRQIKDGTTRKTVDRAGYAGLATAARAGRARQVTLVAPEEHFVNRVRLHEVAAGRTRHQPAIAHVLRGRDVAHVRARVTELDLAGRKVFTDGGGDAIGYDTLVYALGSRTAWHDVPGAREHAYATERAEELRARLRRSDDGEVAVVGGGATGIELAAEIAEAYPNRRVTIVATGQVGGWFSPKGRAIVHENLRRLGVVLREHSEVTAVDGAGLTTVRGRVEADITVWAASFEVGPLAADSGLAVNERGEALVDEYLRSVSHPEVYVAGDAAAVTMPGIGRLRKGCVTAESMGRYLGGALADRNARPFDFGYTIQCLSLGRRAGLVQRVARDDAMTERAYGGRVGKVVKAGIAKFIVTGLR